MYKPTHFFLAIDLYKYVNVVCHLTETQYPDTVPPGGTGEDRIEHKVVAHRIKNQVPAYSFLINMLDCPRTEINLSPHSLSNI